MAEVDWRGAAVFEPTTRGFGFGLPTKSTAEAPSVGAGAAPILGGSVDRVAAHAALDLVLDAAEDDGRNVAAATLTSAIAGGHRVVAAVQGAMVAVGAQWEASGDWTDDGSLSVGSWLVSNTGCSRREAGRLRATARRLTTMPHVAAAARGARLPFGHIAMLADAWCREVASVFERDEAALVAAAEHLTADALRAELRAWYLRALEELETNEPAGKEPGTDTDEVTLSGGFAGQGTLHGALTAASTATLGDALAAELDHMHQAGELVDDGRTQAQRRAEAFMRIVARGTHPGTRRGRPRPSLIARASLVDLFGRAGTPTEARLGIRNHILGGGPVATSTLQRLLCEADLSIVITDDDEEPLYLGRQRRHASAAQWNALIARSGGTCEFPDCTADHTWCVAHHLTPYEHGGRTDLPNLAMVCQRHHTAIHEGRVDVHRAPDGLRFRTSAGQAIAPAFRPNTS